VGLAVAYRGIAEFDTALEQYDTILAADSCNLLALLNKAIVQHRFVAPGAGEISTIKKELEKAKKIYRRLDECDPGNQAAADGLASVIREVVEKEQELAEIADLERQLAELDEKAKVRAVELTATMARGDAVFQKYADVEQDPSWFEVYLMQREAIQFAIEAEDFFFMEEQGAYYDEFMVQYFTDALLLDTEEWTSGEAIEMPEPEAPEGEAAPEGDGAEPAGDAAPEDGDPAEVPSDEAATEEAPQE
jgi:tetratricopeptide (TPR) repeat protein